MPDLYSALTRVQHACDSLKNATLIDQPSPGNDVTLFRALRELHRVLSTTEGEAYDPNRLVRTTLFHGLAEVDK